MKRTGVQATYQIAMAAGQDAGDRSMSKAGRTVWNEEDWDASVEAFERLMGLS